MSGENRKLSAIIGILMNIFAVMYFDAHTHDLNAGLNSVIQVGVSDHPNYFCSVGIHPHSIDPISFDSALNIIKEKAIHPACLAIGETGLDKNSSIDLSMQRIVFERQIQLSEELELPLILHCVRSWPEVLEIRKRIKPLQTWIFHGFAKHNLGFEVMKENILFSFGKALFQHPDLGEVLKRIPVEKMLLETDNSAISIEEIYKKASDITGIDEVQLQAIIEMNFKQTFTKWHIG